MKFSEWIECEKGRATAVASHFGLTLAAVSHWKRFGVPVSHMAKVRDFSAGAVSLEEMLPRLPRPARKKAVERAAA